MAKRTVHFGFDFMLVKIFIKKNTIVDRISKKGTKNQKIAIPVYICCLMYISEKWGNNMNFCMMIENTSAAFQAQNPHISERAAAARP